jgi:hypothetical protein
VRLLSVQPEEMARTCLDEVKDVIPKGLEDYHEETYRENADVSSVTRYHLVRGLAFCHERKSIGLLEIAAMDSHMDVRAFAKEILRKTGC